MPGVDSRVGDFRAFRPRVFLLAPGILLESADEEWVSVLHAVFDGPFMGFSGFRIRGPYLATYHRVYFGFWAQGPWKMAPKGPWKYAVLASLTMFHDSARRNLLTHKASGL